MSQPYSSIIPDWNKNVIVQKKFFIDKSPAISRSISVIIALVESIMVIKASTRKASGYFGQLGGALSLFRLLETRPRNCYKSYTQYIPWRRWGEDNIHRRSDPTHGWKSAFKAELLAGMRTRWRWSCSVSYTHLTLPTNREV